MERQTCTYNWLKYSNSQIKKSGNPWVLDQSSFFAWLHQCASPDRRIQLRHLHLHLQPPSHAKTWSDISERIASWHVQDTGKISITGCLHAQAHLLLLHPQELAYTAITPRQILLIQPKKGIWIALISVTVYYRSMWVTAWWLINRSAAL